MNRLKKTLFCVIITGCLTILLLVSACKKKESPTLPNNSSNPPPSLTDTPPPTQIPSFTITQTETPVITSTDTPTPTLTETSTETGTPTVLCIVEISPTITPVVHFIAEPDICPGQGCGLIPYGTPSLKQSVIEGDLSGNDTDYFNFWANEDGIYTFYLDCFYNDDGLSDSLIMTLFNFCDIYPALGTTNTQTGALKMISATLVKGNQYFFSIYNGHAVLSGKYKIIILTP